MPWRNPYFDPRLAHHTEAGFRNPEASARIGGDFRRWRRERKAQQLPRPPAAGYTRFAQQWCRTPDFPAGGARRVWWLGHACVLLRLGGVTLLTDPVFSLRASPVSFAGPARRTPSVVQVDALPPIDVVLISHNHYDHLDRPTVQALAQRARRERRSTRFLVPLGLATLLKRYGAAEVYELDWWGAHEHAGLRFRCVPAQHWSARTLIDRNRTLWCGWTVHEADFGFYFAGDTGYWRGLAEIPRRAGAIDLAALPIGAYAPRWFMQGQHIDPAEAVQLHRELGIRRSLAIHWGSFELSDESLDEPPLRLREALLAQAVGEDDFWLMQQGESREL